MTPFGPFGPEPSASALHDRDARSFVGQRPGAVGVTHRFAPAAASK